MQISTPSTADRFRSEFPRFRDDFHHALPENQEILADQFLGALSEGHDDGAGLAKLARSAAQKTGSGPRRDIYNLAFRNLAAANTALPPFVSQMISLIPEQSWFVEGKGDRLTEQSIAAIRPQIKEGSPQAELLNLVEGLDQRMRGDLSLTQLKPELEEPVGLPAVGREALFQSREELQGIKALSEVLENKSGSRTKVFLDFAGRLPESEGSEVGALTRRMVFDALMSGDDLTKTDQKDLFKFARRFESKDGLRAFGESTQNVFYNGVSRFGVESGEIKEAFTHLASFKGKQPARQALKALMTEIQEGESEENRHQAGIERGFELFSSGTLRRGQEPTTEPSIRVKTAQKIWLELSLSDISA